MAYNNLLKQLATHIPAVLIFLVVAAIYFLPQLQGKVIQAGDIISNEGMSQEVKAFEDATGERSLWTNAMFGGMPTYQIDSAQPNNLLKYVLRSFKLFIPQPIGLFFRSALLFYILLIFFRINPWLSIIGSLAFTFSVGNMLLYEAGHMSKLWVFASFPIIFVGLLKVIKKEYWAGAIIFALGLGLNLYCNHVQMTYYFFMALGIYVLFEIYARWKAQDLQSLMKGLGILIVATLVAIGSSSSKIITTLEYSADTMRGKPILVKQNADPNSSSQTEGLAWSYAMQWSNGPMDLVAGLIPGVVGGGSGEKLGEDSELYQDLSRKGANLGNNFKAPLYWGVLPGTGGPYYYGAIFCFLFVLGLILYQGPIKWAIATILLLFSIMSMGINAEAFNRFLFDYLPLLNKFRTPNSILWVSGFFVPILGVLVLSDIIKGKITKEKVMKGLLYAAGITGGICLFFGLAGASMFDFAGASDARLEQAGYSLQALIADRKSHMQSDAFRSLVLILLAAGAIWAFINEKMKSTPFIVLIGILSLGDVFMVDTRYVDKTDFVNKTTYKTNFQARPVDQQILKDPAIHYRVHDLSINTFNSASSSYLHKTIGGYHPAKLQRYQDIIENYISQGNQNALAMLNTKYIITQKQEAQKFPGLGNAWFVGASKMASTAQEEIESIKDIDPSQTAIVHQEFAEEIAGLAYSTGGSITLKSYAPNHLEYESNNSGDGLAVFSEVWYGPDKGWQAYIDNEKVDHIRTNYVLRGLKIPAGKHKVEFKFEPSSYYLGEKLTLFFSILIILGFIWVIYSGAKNYQPAPVATPVVEKKKPATVSKSKRKKK